MKKLDIIIALFIGEITALSFLVILKNIGAKEIELFYWILPLVFPILCLAGLWVAFLIGKKFLIIWQAGKFVLTGGLNTFLDLGALNFLIFISGISSGFYYSIFKGISFIIALINSYFWNKFWTFKKTQPDKPLPSEKDFNIKEAEKSKNKFLQFFAISVVGFGINVGTASIIVNFISPSFGLSSQIWANIGAIVAAFTGMTWNFLGYKFIVFK